MRTRPAVAGGVPLFESRLRLARPTLPPFDSLAPDIRAVLEGGYLSKGRHLAAFERALAHHLGVRHALAVSSCTTGLMLAYRALGLAGEVVLPSFTFMATAGALVWAGARPVFADSDPRTANLDPASAERAVTARTTAIVAVHAHGNPADVRGLRRVAERHGLRLVFDAAHAFGSLRGGRPVGAEGDASVFSLSSTKLLSAGEGGVVATDDDEVAGRVRVGREYGNGGGYDSAFAGLNGRLTELGALLALRGLPHLEEAARHRNRLAEIYREGLAGVPGIGFQLVRGGERSSYKDFSVTVEGEGFGLTRDELALALEAENVETRKYFDPPVHRQAAYREFAPEEGSLPHAEWLAGASLSLPIWSEMEAGVVERVCEAVRRAHESAADVRDALRRGEVARATGTRT